MEVAERGYRRSDIDPSCSLERCPQACKLHKSTAVTVTVATPKKQFFFFFFPPQPSSSSIPN
uniref:Uncharacterized protein n=1 Tax=Rhizophora mucronata TaxID=61149 RepID=A0A2P2LF54_RHIMU